jgi:hypothetical protein
LSDLSLRLAHTFPVANPTSVRRFRSRSVKIVVSIAALSGALALLAFNYDLSKVGQDLGALPPTTVAIVAVALLCNALVAVLRFKTIASDMGNPISWRRAMASVSAGSLAGALFFQLAGQLIARSTIMRRGGVPLANVVVITLYERAVAAVLSGLLAIAGAYFVFGRIYIDPEAGGADLIRLIIGLIAATTVGAIVGYGRNAARTVLPLLSERFAFSLLRIFAITLCVQLPIMVAYVAMAHALSPEVAVVDLTAASAVVMFAASVPISLAGREMSAVAALGLIGVSGHAAFTTAIIIGVGSLATMAIVTAISVPALKNETAVQPDKSAAPKIDYTMALSWALPLAAATCVLFQVYIPLGSSLLNVNLADPIALIAGALFIVVARQTGVRKLWRVPNLNVALALTTATLTISLFIGIGSFGYTTWAWVNRYLGWFVLLAYGATGALIVAQGGVKGRRSIFLTYVGATIAVAAVDLGTLVLRLFDIYVTRKNGLEAFSQNHNFFAFQLLMALSAIFVIAKGKHLRISLMSIALVALWFAGSRSGWITLLCITGVALYLNAVGIRELAISLVVTAIAALVPLFYHLVTSEQVATFSQIITSGNIVTNHSLPIAPEIIPPASDNQERLLSLD